MMKQFINKILGKMTEICKPQKKFVTDLLTIIMSCHGKMNFRNMSRYSTYSEKSFSRNYKKPFNFAEFNQRALSKVFESDSMLIAAFDPSFIAKSGKQTYGKDYFWNGSAGKAERGLEISLLSVIDIDYNTAYAISAQQTPPIAASRKKGGVKSAESRMDVYLKHIAQHKKYLPSKVKHLAVDGAFGKEKFVTGITNLDMDIVGKLRIDANLKHAFDGKQKKRGRPKKYGDKFNINDLDQLEFTGKTDDGKVKLYTAIMHSISLKRSIKIVVLINDSQKDKTGRAILFSTDLNLTAFEIFRFYKARFQIEFLFRDAKQFTGLGDCQARLQTQLEWHFNASFSALNITKIEDRIHKKSEVTQRAFSMASWKARNFNEHYINTIFSMLGFDLSLIKSTPHFETLRNYGTISK